jgi:hypothetical protein
VPNEPPAKGRNQTRRHSVATTGASQGRLACFARAIVNLGRAVTVAPRELVHHRDNVAAALEPFRRTAKDKIFQIKNYIRNDCYRSNR